MKKKELTKKITEFVKKSKDFSIKKASQIKEKIQDFVIDFKERRAAAKFTKTLKAKAKQNKTVKTVKTAKTKSLYDRKEKDLRPTRYSFNIKPMSEKAEKVAIKKSLFSSFKTFSFSRFFYFSDFTVKTILFGTTFISAWFLSLSFSTQPNSYAAFIALFLMALSIRYIKTACGSMIYGILTGFFTNLFVLGWIYDTVLFGTANTLLAVISLIGLSLFLSVFMLLFCFFAWQYKHKLIIYPLASACAWVALELVIQLVSYKGLGFPWFVLGYTQYSNLNLIQISSLTGAYGVSFFIVFCSFGASLVLGRGVFLKDRLLNIIAIIALWGVFNAYANYQLNTSPTEEEKILQTVIVQPNTHNEMMSGRIEEVKQTLEHIAQVINNEENIDLVIWPESTLPSYLEEGPLKDFMAKISSSTKTAHIAGASARVKQKEEKNKKNQKNKQKTQDIIQQEFVAAGLYQNGKLIAQHNKRKLVPFGEFLPFSKQLDIFYKSNGITALTGDYIEGSGLVQIFTLQEGENKTSFGTQICFESIFPILWRLEALGGAEFFVNISNDGWFLNTAAPYQHLIINIFRAVENRRPVLRSATTGISAYIDSFGNIKYQSKLNETEAEIMELILPKTPVQTFYTIYGDIFAFLCLFLTLVFSYNCLDLTQEND